MLGGRRPPHRDPAIPPKGLFDLVIGLDRWLFRVVVYVALMTDVYPPFRLDQGATEPGPAMTDLGEAPALLTSGAR